MDLRGGPAARDAAPQFSSSVMHTEGLFLSFVPKVDDEGDAILGAHWALIRRPGYMIKQNSKMGLPPLFFFIVFFLHGIFFP